MRRALIFAVVVAVAVGLPVIAYSRDGTIPIDLTLTTTDQDGENGTIAGTFGGVPVNGTFAGDEDSGDWILTVDGQHFAGGTYTCGHSGCVFTGTTLMGRPTSFAFSTSGRNGAFTGNFQGLFRNHGAWVSTVAKWSNTNLAPGRIGKIVSGAAKSAGSATKVQESTTKIQGAQATRAGKAGSRIEARGHSTDARTGGNGRVGQAKDADTKDRGNGTSASQGNGGGQGHGNGNGGGKGK